MTDLRVRVGGRGKSKIMPPASGGIVGTDGVWEQVTIPTGIILDATNVPSGTYYAGYTPGGSPDFFGAVGLTADPYNVGRFYVCFCGQGLWRSDTWGNDGTWYQINDGKQTVAMDGTLWSMAFGPGFMLLVNGYGSDLGIFRSTDGGPTFTKITALAGGGTFSSDVACVAVCAADTTRCMATAHGPTSPIPDWYWSKTSGVTWIAIPDQGQGIANNGTWLDANTFISQGPNGVWQGKVDGSDVWTFTKVIDTESNHGGTQMWLDTVNSRLWVGVALPGPGRQQIFYTTLANRGDSGTWVLAEDVLGGGAYGCSTLIGTTGFIYGQGNYATHIPYGPVACHAALPAGTSWTIDSSMPAWYQQGAHSFGMAFDGTRSVVLAALDNVGISRLAGA